MRATDLGWKLRLTVTTQTCLENIATPCIVLLLCVLVIFILLTRTLVVGMKQYQSLLGGFTSRDSSARQSSIVIRQPAKQGSISCYNH